MRFVVHSFRTERSVRNVIAPEFPDSLMYPDGPRFSEVRLFTLDISARQESTNPSVIHSGFTETSSPCLKPGGRVAGIASVLVGTEQLTITRLAEKLIDTGRKPG